MNITQAQRPSETVAVVIVAQVFIVMSDVDIDFPVSEPCKSHLTERFKSHQASPSNSEQFVMFPKQDSTWPIFAHQHFDRALRFTVAVYAVTLVLSMVYFI